MGQATPAQPLLKINGENLEVVHQFQYLGSTMMTPYLWIRLGFHNSVQTRQESLRKQTSENTH